MLSSRWKANIFLKIPLVVANTNYAYNIGTKLWSESTLQVNWTPDISCKLDELCTVADILSWVSHFLNITRQQRAPFLCVIDNHIMRYDLCAAIPLNTTGMNDRLHRHKYLHNHLNLSLNINKLYILSQFKNVFFAGSLKVIGKAWDREKRGITY